MFEHLDDERPFSPTDDFHQTVLSGAARRIRRRHRTWVASTTVMLVAGASLVYARSVVHDDHRITVGGLTTIEPQDTGTGNPSGTPVSPLTAPINILLVNVDGGASTDPAWSVPDSERWQKPRSDGLTILRVDPVGHRLATLSIPPGLWLPDSSGHQRIGDLVVSDPAQLAAAVTKLTGVPIDHYLLVDFDGFKQIIDHLGGVDLPFDTTVDDPQVAFTATPGCNHLDGDLALAYIRSRHISGRGADGVLYADPTGFEGTIARRIDLLRRLLTKVVAQPVSAAIEAGLVDFFLSNVTVDDTLTAPTLRSTLATIDQVGPTLTAYNLNQGIKATNVDGAAGLVADPQTIEDATNSFLNASSSDPGSPNPAQAIIPADRQC
jgi:LCP family protein required for cell wall assembly